MASMAKLRTLKLGQLDELIVQARIQLRALALKEILDLMVTRNVTIEDITEAGGPHRDKVVAAKEKEIANAPLTHVRYQNPRDKRQQWTASPGARCPSWYMDAIRRGTTEQQLRVPLKKKGDTPADKEHGKRGCVSVRAGSGVVSNDKGKRRG